MNKNACLFSKLYTLFKTFKKMGRFELKTAFTVEFFTTGVTKPLLAKYKHFFLPMFIQFQPTLLRIIHKCLLQTAELNLLIHFRTSGSFLKEFRVIWNSSSWHTTKAIYNMISVKQVVLLMFKKYLLM